MKRTGPIRVISFALLVVSGVLGQKPPATERLQGSQVDDSISSEMQRQTLPDAPSAVQPPTLAVRFRTLASETEAGTINGVLGLNAGRFREMGLGHFVPGPQRSLNALYQVTFIQEEPSSFLGMYLYPPPLQQAREYHPSTSDSLMGRATFAASRIFVTRDDSGKGRLNTRYFLGVLSAVAMHAAYRPYQARSTSATFNRFGSTIGGDAGINIFREFRPGIRQMVKGITPKFMFRIEDRVTSNQIQKR